MSSKPTRVLVPHIHPSKKIAVIIKKQQLIHKSIQREICRREKRLRPNIRLQNLNRLLIILVEEELQPYNCQNLHLKMHFIFNPFSTKEMLLSKRYCISYLSLQKCHSDSTRKTITKKNSQVQIIEREIQTHQAVH